MSNGVSGPVCVCVCVHSEIRQRCLQALDPANSAMTKTILQDTIYFNFKTSPVKKLFKVD